jgi:ABC-2 type transport system ATP-binding protein
MLRLEHITKRYGTFTAVDDLSFSLAPGKILGFLGPNGAGKTTTMKMICGLVRPTAGRIHVGGLDIARSPLPAKAQVGYVPDRPHLHDRLTALEQMYFVGGLYGLDPELVQTRSQSLLELFGLAGKFDHLVESYSHGMKQRLVMASVLLHAPKLLVVDEPMVGLDPMGSRLLKDVLRARAAEGMSVLLSTHTLDVADEVCDEIAVIHHGHLIAHGTPQSLRSRTGVEGARLETVFLQLTSEEGPAGS